MEQEILKELKKVNDNLRTLIALWNTKEAKLAVGGKKAITTGEHSPMTPEQAYYSRLANENKASTERM